MGQTPEPAHRATAPDTSLAALKEGLTVKMEATTDSEGLLNSNDLALTLN